ncbi:Uncharacterised protein [Mycobacteroides abscessus subsp. abscessus]|nr:Uncharacterised protein [Mycobacteroides abscessus subsp. abscessus]
MISACRPRAIQNPARMGKIRTAQSTASATSESSFSPCAISSVQWRSTQTRLSTSAATRVINPASTPDSYPVTISDATDLAHLRIAELTSDDSPGSAASFSSPNSRTISSIR